MIIFVDTLCGFAPLAPCPMSNLRNSYVALTILGVKGNTTGDLGTKHSLHGNNDKGYTESKVFFQDNIEERNANNNQGLLTMTKSHGTILLYCDNNKNPHFFDYIVLKDFLRDTPVDIAEGEITMNE